MTSTIVSRRDLLDDENNTVADRVSKFHALSFPLKIQEAGGTPRFETTHAPYTNTETNRELYDFTLPYAKMFRTRNVTQRADKGATYSYVLGRGGEEAMAGACAPKTEGARKKIRPLTKK